MQTWPIIVSHVHSRRLKVPSVMQDRSTKVETVNDGEEIEEENGDGGNHGDS